MVIKGPQKKSSVFAESPAEVKKNFIEGQGIAADRILTDGKGIREPLNANKNEDERALNRRVELTILYDE
jgi:outer membrane protein OmpA-like peptidoglycan-associated protein